MIKLRLQRKGRKKRPFYHIVVADSRSPRDGRIIEQLGRFDNVSENKVLTYNEERIIHWLNIGAQPSDTVRSILKKEGILYKMHLLRWGKSEEEINAALEEWKAAREAKQAEKDTSRKSQQKELLKSEEKEFKKQLEEKAAAAAKELEKKKEKEAEAAEAEKVEDVEEAGATAETEETVEPGPSEGQEQQEEVAAAEEKPATEEKEAPTEPVAEEKEEAKTESAVSKEEDEEAKTEPAASEKEETKAKAKPAAKEKEEEKEEAEAEAKADKKDSPAEEKSDTVSTDMKATEAIDHIKDTPLDKLKGFVPEDEERVTVLRAWESKQSD